MSREKRRKWAIHLSPKEDSFLALNFMIRLLGNIPVASKYLTWAKHKLTYIKRMLAIFDDQHLFSHWYKFPDANVFINTCNGLDYISIWGMIGGALIIAQPGTSTTDFTTRRYYDIFGNDLQIPSGQKPAGWTLLDDGTYGFIGSISDDDPDVDHSNPLTHRHISIHRRIREACWFRQFLTG